MFACIVEFESFTGGDGDADEAAKDEEEGVERRLVGARRGGKDIGDLTASTYLKWKKLGWYEIFQNA